MKRCSKCKKRKPKSAFYKNKNSLDGLYSYCKECTKNIGHKQYEANSERIKKRSRRWKKDNPEKVKKINRRWYKANSEKARERSRKYYKRNPEEVKERNRKQCLKKYGLSLKEYARIFRKQGGVCAICGEPEQQPKRKYLCVDHDHRTEKFRGLLCSECNLIVGIVEKNPLVLQKVTTYLSKHSRKKEPK